MIPIILEVGRKINKGVDLEDDKNLSAYAKWVADLAGKANENTTSVQKDTDV